jgi:DNA-binding CsgD family transcriptional regulator
MRDTKLTIDPSLKMLFDQMPGCWGCKDENSIFMYANKEYSKIIGLKENNLEVIGRTDFDMPCSTVSCAELFRKQDKEVIVTQKRMRVLDIHPFDGGEWKAYVFTKTPLYDHSNNGKIIGTIFHGADITNTSMMELGSFLSKMREDITHEFLGAQSSYLLGSEFCKIKLTVREAESLFFTLRGKTAKQIARYLGISYRTVEEHINNIKTKFNAQNRYDLIDKAIQAGFLNTIPESIFCTQLSAALNDN